MMPSHRALGVALFGYGVGGRFFHAPMIAATPGLEIVAVVTSNEERANQARAEHPAVRVSTNAESLFEDLSGIDLAVVSTPNRTHVPLALASLDAGLHVVVDKPMAPTSAEARLIVEAAESRQRMLTVYHNRRFDGDFLTVQRLIRDNALGKVHRFESRFERWRPIPNPGWRESGDPRDAGGLLFDLGPHLIDQSIVLFGAVTDVYAEIDRRRPGVDVDDDVFVALTHSSGVRSHLWMSALAGDAGPRFRILGDRAGYTKFGMDVQEEALRRGVRPGADGWGTEPQDRRGSISAGDEARPVRTEPGDYGMFYSAVVAAIRGGSPAPVDPSDAVRVLDVIEAARKSDAERRAAT